MHYWQLHIGDWSKSCGHLNPSETGFYVRLLNIYYDTEKPIPADVSAACRLVGARTPRERDEISCLLSEFFSLEVDGWHNKRADNEINKMHQKSEKARNSISHRWNNERNTNVSGTNNEGNTPQESKNPRHQEPIQGQEQSATPPIPHAPKKPKVQTRGARLPDDFALTDELRAAAEKIGVPSGAVHIEADQFADHWKAKTGKDAYALDWLARWRTWCRNSVKWTYSKSGSGVRHDGANQGAGRRLSAVERAQLENEQHRARRESAGGVIVNG